MRVYNFSKKRFSFISYVGGLLKLGTKDTAYFYLKNLDDLTHKHNCT